MENDKSPFVVAGANPIALRVLDLVQQGQHAEAARYADQTTTEKVREARKAYEEVQKEREQILAMVALLGLPTTKREPVRELDSWLATTFRKNLTVRTTEIPVSQNSESLKPSAQEIVKSLPLPRARIPDADRSASIKKQAVLLARKKTNRTVSAHEVVQELEARGFELGISVPNTAVGNVLNRDDEWERVEKGVFRYIGNNDKGGAS
jgi:hypothetical protein